MVTYNLSFVRTDPIAQRLVGFNDAGILVSGTQKLAERFTCRLLTRKGSIPYLPKQGCSFISNLRISGMFTEGDIFTSFAAAMLDLKPSLSAEESASDPSDERFATAILTKVTVTGELLLLTIQVISQAGGTINTTLPLRFSLT